MELRSILQKLIEQEGLEERELSFFAEELADGHLTNSQIAGFLVGLRAKGETVSEITALAKTLMTRAVKINPKVNILIDTVGTGGDLKGTFNISTTAAFIEAGAGVAVAKHGNRAVSSRCGSADVLEALGVNIHVSPARVTWMIENIGIGFLFAPEFHPALTQAAAARKELGIRTIFNLLGPLLNPAGAKVRLVGVYDPSLTEKLAGVLCQLGVEAAMVVHGSGLDEITITGPTRISELKNGSIHTYEIMPEDFGFKRAQQEDLCGGSSQENARILLDILKGQKGPKRDAALLNAGAALYLCGKAKTMHEGIALARRSVDSGAAHSKLEDFIQASQE